MPRIARGRPAEPSDEMLQKAADFFRTHGYGGASVREIGNALDLPPSTLYYYVRSKQELLRAVCVDALNAIIKAGAEARDNSPRGASRLTALIAAHMSTMLSDQSKHATVLLEMRSLDEGIGREVVGLRDEYESLVKLTIAEARDDGLLRRDLDADTMTLLLLNLLNWTIFWYRPGGGLSPEQLASAMTTMFLDGAAARPPQPSGPSETETR
jgi:AcrR family transcriptional regulator